MPSGGPSFFGGLSLKLLGPLPKKKHGRATRPGIEFRLGLWPRLGWACKSNAPGTAHGQGGGGCGAGAGGGGEVGRWGGGERG